MPHRKLPGSFPAHPQHRALNHKGNRRIPAQKESHKQIRMHTCTYVRMYARMYACICSCMQGTDVYVCKYVHQVKHPSHP